MNVHQQHFHEYARTTKVTLATLYSSNVILYLYALYVSNVNDAKKKYIFTLLTDRKLHVRRCNVFYKHLLGISITRLPQKRIFKALKQHENFLTITVSNIVIQIAIDPFFSSSAKVIDLFNSLVHNFIG